MTVSFCGLNLKGMLALFSAVSRCWLLSAFQFLDIVLGDSLISRFRDSEVWDEGRGVGYRGKWQAGEEHTTASASLATFTVARNWRCCWRTVRPERRTAVRRSRGAILEAIVAVCRRNGCD
jgi:hypothetical protein